MQPRINVITLGVEDFQRSLAFYKNGLGWTSKVHNDVAFFQLNGIVFALYPRDKLAEDATVPAKGSGFTGITIAYCGRNENEVDEVLALAEKHGAKIVKPAQNVFWGGYSGYFADPDGYLWEVAFNPMWTLDKKGNVRL
jgi:catechol 2,3-dioxygenase-like lactoylglutathione lyase family enzyme